MKELKRLVEESKRYHKASLAEDASEEETDAAYAEYWARLKKIADELYAITGGRIDRNTGLKMAIHKGDKILGLVSKMA